MHGRIIKKNVSIEQFLELFLSLIESGISITAAIKTLSEGDGTKEYAVKVLKKLYGSEPFGMALCSLSKKMEGYEAVIMSAEKTGNIIPSLKGIVEELKQKEEGRREAFAVCLYPVFVVIAASILSILLFKYALPFIRMVARIDERQMILGIVYADIWLLVSIPLAILVIRYYSSRYDFETTVFRTLWSFEEGGRPAAEALGILMRKEKSVKRSSRILAVMADGLRSGKTLCTSCEETCRFDSFTTAWLGTAEESGQARKCFYEIYGHYKAMQKRNRETVRRFLEPVITGICGVYIVILVTQLIVPVFKTIGEGLL